MFKDRSVLAAMGVGLGLRVLPLVLWGAGGCVRDECTYKGLAEGIVKGKGLLSHEGWLWAPGWPYTLAVFQAAFGSVNPARGLQVAASVLTIGLAAVLVRRVADVRAARVAAWLFALHATFAWFAGSLFSEVVYTALLLMAVITLLWSREGDARRALVPGLLVGACVLFRGVATYLGPIFLVVALWPVDERLMDAARARWKHAVAFALAMSLTVAPYSLYASHRHGGFVISDATLGQMMWLGDNDFPPMTFDWGNGQIDSATYDAWAKAGRQHCNAKLPAARWDACERANGKAWIADHPAEFLRRIPLRLAQLVTPHTFLTRHVRSGRWPGLPFEVKEPLLAVVAATSLAVILGGGAAAWLRARGPLGALVGGVVAYHMLAISLLAGMSRYRVPLEPFGVVFLAIALAEPRGTLQAARAEPLRAVLAAVWVLALLPLMLWTLPDGFPGWR